MTESAKSKNAVPFEASIPEGAVPLESILCTEELHRRPWRPPDYGKENRALVALAIALADSPRTILQMLAEKVLEVVQADSAGLSLLTKDEKRFYWPAIAGAWQPHLGGGTRRDFGPCGDVLDCNVPLLFTHWERRYPYLRPATPLAEEGLLVPFYVRGKAVGTIWAIAHNDRRKFDAEDLRLLESLGRFASAAYQALTAIDDLSFQIAEREKAEAAVRELAHGLEAKLRRLVDSNIIGIFICGLDGRIIDANEAFLGIVGYGRDDLVSGRMSWRELTPAEYHDADDRCVAQLKATGTAQPYEKEYFQKSGRRVPVLVGAALFEGRLEEGVGFVLDLTERKRAEEALVQRERRFRALIEHSTETILLCNREGTVIYASPTLEGMRGYTPEEHVGRSVFDVVHRDHLQAARDQFAALVREPGRVAGGQHLVRHKDGSWRWSETRTRSLLHEPSVQAVVINIRDITERKEAEEALRRTQADLAHVTRVMTMGELASSIAHEVNQPLAAVVTNGNACLRWLAAEPPNLAEARECLSGIVRDGKRAGEVIARIRSLAKKSAPAKARLNLNEAIPEVLAIISPEARQHEVSVRTELAASLPPVSGDRVQLQQVLLNLVMNGIEAMKAVTDRPRELMVRSQSREAGAVLVAVQDAGIGLDRQSMGRLFEAFYTTKPSGMGMGLSISRSIVEAHGGRLWATPNSGPGATFQFTLPTGGENEE